MTYDDGQDRKRKRRPSGDEGAPYTLAIAAEVAGRRTALGWSAERLAEEMNAAGIPWTRDVVVNLENGRRKTLAVHELLALAWLLDVASPATLLVPAALDESGFPVTPLTRAPAAAVRAWFKGETGPLRANLGYWAMFEDDIRYAVERTWAEKGPIPGKTSEEVVDSIVDGMRQRRPDGAWGLRRGAPTEGADDGQD